FMRRPRPATARIFPIPVGQASSLPYGPDVIDESTIRLVPEPGQRFGISRRRTARTASPTRGEPRSRSPARTSRGVAAGRTGGREGFLLRDPGGGRLSEPPVQKW